MDEGLKTSATTPTRLTGAQALVRLLQAQGVQLVFGIASGKLAPLLQALSQQDAIRFVGLRHEASGPMMAAAVAAAGQGMAVALGEMGPGALNLAAGAGGGFNNRLPMLLITTNQHRAASYPGHGMFMDLDTQGLMAPVTVWRAVVGDARRLPELVHTAFRQALGPRPGPVHLDIPQDVLAAPCDIDPALLDQPPGQRRALAGPRPDGAGVAQAADLLRQARRPLIVAGGGVVASGAEGLLRDLATRLQAPVACTQMALGVVPSDSPHSVGQGGLIGGPGLRQALAEADLVLSIGCRWSSWLWDEQGPMLGQTLRPGLTHVAINTDPTALGHPAPHTLALQADARAALADLLAALPLAGPDAGTGGQPPPDQAGDLAPGATAATGAGAAAAAAATATATASVASTATDPAWLARARAPRLAHEARLAELAADRPVVGQPMHPDAGQPMPPPAGRAMHPAALAQAIAQALPPDALVVMDGGHTSFWTNDFTAVHSPRTRFHEPGMCQLGFGLPQALALQLLHPGRPVFNITGDGSFGFTLQELDTARRLGLPVVTIIHNNAAWGIIRAGQKALGNFELGTSLAGTDYAAIARGFGGHGETITTPDQVAPAIQRALANAVASGLPTVIDAHCRFEPHPAMPDFGRMNRFGFAPAA